MQAVLVTGLTSDLVVHWPPCVAHQHASANGAAGDGREAPASKPAAAAAGGKRKAAASSNHVEDVPDGGAALPYTGSSTVTTLLY